MRPGGSVVLGVDDRRASRPRSEADRPALPSQDWFERLATGKASGLEAIAKDEQVTGSWVARVIHLAFLAPDIAQATAVGITSEKLIS